jgi:hypothetical protein
MREPNGICILADRDGLVGDRRGLGTSRAQYRSSPDSALEGDGFEPSVPPSTRRPSRRDPRATTDVSRDDLGLMIPSSLSVRHLRLAEPREPSRRAVPMVRIRFPPADSLGLAQTRPLQVEKPAVPRGCAPPRSAETRSTGRNCANWRCYLCRAIFQYRSAAAVARAVGPRPSLTCGWANISSKAEQGALLVPGQRQT